MKKGEVNIAEMSIRIGVIAFALNQFTQEMITEIREYIAAHPFHDDLALNDGQITVDESLKIIYTGSAAAANFIALNYKKISIRSKKYSVTVFKKNIPEASVPAIMAMVACTKPNKKPAPEVALHKKRHNLEPVLEELRKQKQIGFKKEKIESPREARGLLLLFLIFI